MSKPRVSLGWPLADVHELGSGWSQNQNHHHQRQFQTDPFAVDAAPAGGVGLIGPNHHHRRNHFGSGSVSNIPVAGFWPDHHTHQMTHATHRKDAGWFHPRSRLCGRAVPGASKDSAGVVLAEEVGFEPTVDFHPRRFSRPVQSTALPLLRRRLLSRADWKGKPVLRLFFRGFSELDFTPYRP